MEQRDALTAVPAMITFSDCIGAFTRRALGWWNW
jgi:hypothetical protein